MKTQTAEEMNQTVHDLNVETESIKKTELPGTRGKPCQQERQRPKAQALKTQDKKWTLQSKQTLNLKSSRHKIPGDLGHYGKSKCKSSNNRGGQVGGGAKVAHPYFCSSTGEAEAVGSLSLRPG